PSRPPASRRRSAGRARSPSGASAPPTPARPPSRSSPPPPARSSRGRRSVPEPLRIVVGSDDAGLDYKEALRRDLESHPGVASVRDVGVHDAGGPSYGSVALRAAELVAAGEADRALLICGTGLGVAIAANKVPGIRAVTAHDSYS